MKKFLKNRFLLSVLFSCMAFISSGNHFTGAHLRYEYISNNQYRLHLTLYKTCESGAIDLPSFIGVYAESKLTNQIVNKNLVRVSNDTLQPFCSGTVTSCTNISSAYPGYIVGVYTETIQLPINANDWYFVFSNSNRNFGITNLQGASGQSFFVDAPAITYLTNTSAVMPDYPPHTIFINDSSMIPLTAMDKDGDSIAYEFVQPQSSQGLGIPYYAGYSVAMPFGSGGLCYIDGNNNMILKSTSVGKYTLTLKIKEYRNGLLISYTTRDFIVICTSASAGNALSIPQPKNNGNRVTYTCPGRNNLLRFSFADNNPADSVMLKIQAPSLGSGWNFTTAKTDGIGSATGSINWQTPPGTNPAQLPFFNIAVTASDNSCKLKGEATYIYTVFVRSCSADSVWPGDANADKTADMYDALAVAINYNDTGSARPAVSNNWAAQFCDFWNGSFLNNIDKKHADCNGDGKVDTADLSVISQNYGLTHPKGGARQKGTGISELYFDHSGINPNPDSVVSIKIMLGNSTSPINKIYGLAANVLVDGLSLSTPPDITYSSSWLGNNAKTLNFSKDVSPVSIDWAYARNDKQNVSGNGQIADLVFKIPASTPGGTLVTLSYNRALFIDKDGLELTDISTVEDTFYIRYPANIQPLYSTAMQTRLYPNPSASNTMLEIHVGNQADATIEVTDVAGKIVSMDNTRLKTGTNLVTLPANRLAPGMYMVQVYGSGLQPQTLKWVIR